MVETAVLPVDDGADGPHNGVRSDPTAARALLVGNGLELAPTHIERAALALWSRYVAGFGDRRRPLPASGPLAERSAARGARKPAPVEAQDRSASGVSGRFRTRTPVAW